MKLVYFRRAVLEQGAGAEEVYVNPAHIVSLIDVGDDTTAVVFSVSPTGCDCENHGRHIHVLETIRQVAAAISYDEGLLQ